MLCPIVPLIVAKPRPLLSRLSGEVKNRHHDTLSRRNGVSKGKGNLVEARPAAAMPSAKKETGED